MSPRPSAATSKPPSSSGPMRRRVAARASGRRNATVSMRSSASSPPPLTTSTSGASGGTVRLPPLPSSTVQQAPTVVRADTQPATRDIDDVAFAQPRRPRDRHAVAERRVAAFGRLQEQLAVVQRDPGQRARRRRPAARRCDRAPPRLTGKSAADSARSPSGIAQDQFDRTQIGSSQRTTSVGGGVPGSRLSSLRTSRYPWRVPTMV